MKTPKTSEDVPKETHFAVLIFKTRQIHHEGDERSRTHPGHGYPAHTETVHIIEYVVFSDEDEMKEWISKIENGNRPKPDYKLIRSRPLGVKLSTNVDIRFHD